MDEYKLEMLAIIVDGDLKAPFSIATTPWRRGSATQFPGLFHFTLDPYLIILNVKQGGIKYHFWVFGMTRPGIEPWSLGRMANTLLIRAVTQFMDKYTSLLLLVIRWY